MVGFTNVEFPGQYLVGFSMCSPLDKFNRDFGLDMAIERAISWAQKGKDPVVPSSMRGEFSYFLNRCSKYYKGMDLALSFGNV